MLQTRFRPTQTLRHRLWSRRDGPSLFSLLSALSSLLISLCSLLFPPPPYPSPFFLCSLLPSTVYCFSPFHIYISLSSFLFHPYFLLPLSLFSILFSSPYSQSRLSLFSLPSLLFHLISLAPLLWSSLFSLPSSHSWTVFFITFLFPAFMTFN